VRAHGAGHRARSDREAALLPGVMPHRKFRSATTAGQNSFHHPARATAGEAARQRSQAPEGDTHQQAAAGEAQEGRTTAGKGRAEGRQESFTAVAEITRSEF